VCRTIDRQFPLLLLLAITLSGCGGAGSAPPGVTAAVFSVVVAVWKLRNMANDSLLRNKTSGDPLKDYITELGHHVKFFLRFRAEAHLLTQSDTDVVANAVAAEYDTLRAFVASTIGLTPDSPAALITGTDPRPHLDFNDVLRVRVTAGPVSDSSRKTHELKRWRRAMQIVWRAAALERDLWTPSFSAAALKEILDRRLRITERMAYQISAEVSGQLQPSSALTHGPWPDGVRVRMFEYPILEAEYATQIGAANIGPSGIWKLDFAGTYLYYNEGNARRIRPAAATEFVSAAGTTFVQTYPYDLKPGGSPAAAIDHLFQASDDWWDRSWIYCDQVLAAIHLESLRFGKLRRTGNDTAFDAAVNAHPQGWAQLRPLLPNVLGDPRLMADDAAKPPSEPRLFANGPMPQVQLGDHVVFWNSIMYGLLSDGAWSLENAVVVDVSSDWAANDIGDTVHLMGHGTDDTLAGRFREQLKRDLDRMLASARQKAKAAAGDNTAWLRAAAPLVRWAPFNEPWVDENGVAQAPWWIRVPYVETGDWLGRALGRDATLFTLPDCIEYTAAAGFPAAPPAAGGGPANAAYFPLWWPAQQGKWKGYLERRRNGNVPSTFRLEPVRFDGGNIPGLILPREFVPGSASPQVQTVRPFVVR
jgi:hypothetical protein